MDIGMAFSALSGALNITRLAVEARDDAKARAAISDMASALLNVQSTALSLAEEARALSARLRDAEAETRKLQDRIAEREKYVLHDLHRGRFAYEYAGPETVDGRAVPAHHLCQPCFDNGKKVVLRVDERWGSRLWKCVTNDDHSITGGPV